jgi:hypothetical protein
LYQRKAIAPEIAANAPYHSSLFFLNNFPFSLSMY